MKLTKSKLKQLIKEELKLILEEKETYVLERSGVSWGKKFITGGTPDDPKFGALEKAKTFADKDAAKKYAKSVDMDVSVKNKEDFK
tara:strand:+ start:254 stop:511 length:258 start_codon:yes stop_codon:yes gene_type:complete